MRGRFPSSRGSVLWVLPAACPACAPPWGGLLSTPVNEPVSLRAPQQPAALLGRDPRSQPLGCPASHETRRAALRFFVFICFRRRCCCCCCCKKKGGERSLNHSHTKSCGYHVLQKCDKAQQLRALAPPPLGFFFFFPFFFSSSPSPHQSLFMALLLLRLTPSGTSPWISLCRNPGPCMGVLKGGRWRGGGGGWQQLPRM